MTMANPDRRKPRDQIVLAHGGGGQLTDQLVGRSILPRLGNAALEELLDSGIMEHADGQIALTIDGYVVQPIEFPGGDIGRLAISGTVNDLSVCGARPLGIALSMILAEGLERGLLERVLDSLSAAAREAGVPVVTGDTKVVGRTQADQLYITTAGVGVIPPGRRLHPDQVRPGDAVIINGPIADHGLAVMLAREMPEVQSVLTSDVAPLNGLIARVMDVTDGVVFMRDPTRGGVTGVLCDLAARTGLHIVMDETSIPVRSHTRHAAEMLGLDPLEVANEGKVVIISRPEAANAVLQALRSDPLGREAALIGRIQEPRDGICELHTTLGGRRILQKPYGEQLPRIC
jgi:hydrogenase expression/formation protein HypE